MTHQPSEDDRLSIAIDIGGTTIKGVLLDPAGHIHARHTTPTFVKGDALHTLQTVIKALQPSRSSGASPVSTINICTPGLVQASTGVVSYAANLGWNDLPLARLITAEHHTPTRVDHDARAAASAEALALGSAPGARDLLFVPIGTGVSSAIISDGRPLSGSTGSAGEIGHVIVYPDGELCQCGQRGCVEAYASATTLLNRYRRAGGSAASVMEIVSALHTDPLACQVWEEAVDALARGIAAATATVDPLVVILGGGLSNAGSSLIDPLTTRIAEILTWRRAPRIQQSRLGAHAGLIGAALLSRNSDTQQRAAFVETLHSELHLHRAPLISGATR